MTTTTPIQLRFAATPLDQLAKYHGCVQSFLDSKTENTVDAYQRDLMDFAEYLGIKRTQRGFDIAAATRALAELLTRKQGEAYKLVLGYRTHLFKVIQRAPKTVDRRISTLRSLTKIARTLGLTRLQLDISNLSEGTIRDTKGPEEEGVKRMLRVIEKRYAKGDYQAKRRALRDRALLLLFYCRAFRRADAVGLNIGSVDFPRRRAKLIRKGRHEPEYMTLPQSALMALKSWLSVRGSKDPNAPMFVGIYKKTTPEQLNKRIDPKSVYLIIRDIGKEAGLKTWPHALRHAAGTEALNKTNGDIRAVAKFMGHKNVTTTMIYDDNRRDMGGQVSEKLAGDL